MNKIILATVLLVSVLISKSYAATYSFSGNNFNEVFGEYTLTDNIFGGFVTTVPIDPNAGLVDVTSTLISYTFFDGVQELNESNSKVLVFNVSVTQQGYVDETAMTVWKTPVTTENGGNVQGIDMYRSPQVSQMYGFKDGMCMNNSGPGGECSSAVFGGTNSGVYFAVDFIFSSGFE